LKAALVAEQLRRIARVDHEVTVEPVAGDHEGLGLSLIHISPWRRA